MSENFVLKAVVFAINKHGTQRRRTSQLPYMIHPARVAKNVAEFYLENENFSLTKTELVVAALLHDVLEDTDCSREEIEMLFSKKVADVVQELTSDDAEIARIGKGPYLEAKIAQLSADAFFIKLLDRMDNVSDYLHDGPADRAQAYVEQTRGLLRASVSNSQTNACCSKVVQAILKLVEQ